MRLREIYELLDSISPFELQEEWDNSGLQVGNWDKAIGRIYISLDIDEKVISYAESNSLIITHHPLLFTGLKRVVPDRAAGRYLMSLIKKNICVISMHTNIDKTHLNRFFVEEILNWEGEQEGFIYYTHLDMLLEEIVPLVKSRLGMEKIRVVPTREFVRRAAIVTGAGASLLDQLRPGTDLFLTGDIKYHDAMEAKGRGIGMIDIGHYESERYFSTLLYNLIADKVNVEVQIINSENPFKLM
ncbi:MAG: Nif3-like dinuclear metal center hexameric protein [Campylobacterales bacterium]